MTDASEFLRVARVRASCVCPQAGQCCELLTSPPEASEGMSVVVRWACSR